MVRPAYTESAAQRAPVRLASQRRRGRRTRVHALSRWIERWYVAYALLGAVVAGLVPIAIPLDVTGVEGARAAGLVMAIFNLGGLSATLWGLVVDRHRLHRPLLVGGLVLLGAGLAGFPYLHGLGIRLALALVAGVGTAAATTVANLFVVEAHPRSEWDERIGWLQAFYGAGQVGGLLLAGFFARTLPGAGPLAAALLALLAIVPAWRETRTPPAPRKARPVLTHAVRHGEWPVPSPVRSYHRLELAMLARVRPLLVSPLALFLAAWLLGFASTAAVFALYPVLMARAYGVPPAASSLGFAVAAALGLALYSPAGRWSARWGGVRVMQVGLGARVLALAALALLGASKSEWSGTAPLAAFAVVVLAWSLLTVSGTAITVRLSPVGEGEALGLFNATTAVAGVIGAAAAGWIATAWSYATVPAVAAAGTAAALLLSAPLERRARRAPAANTWS